MTFSSCVKNELYTNFPRSFGKALSEMLAIIIILKAQITVNGNEICFSVENENRNIIKYIGSILSKYINQKNVINNTKYEYLTVNNKYIFEIIVDDEDFFLKSLMRLGRIKLENDNASIDKKSFIKGMFLVCGSSSNPEKGYHLEFIFQQKNIGLYFMNCLNYFNLNSRIIERKKSYTVYIKESDNISKVFSIVGAHNAVLEFESIRVKKEYSNNKNRLKNCIEANEDKLIIASVRHVRAIMLIDKVIGINNLPKNLREVAKIRLKYKEMPLKDLGRFLKPPIGKSGVSHRLRKIEQIAESLKK